MKIKKKIIVNLIIVVMLFFSNIAIGTSNLFSDVNILNNKNNDKIDLYNNYNKNNLEFNDNPIKIDKKIILERGGFYTEFDYINANIGDIIRFQITITYEPIAICGFVATNIKIADELPSCLAYDQTSSIIEYDGQKYFGDTGFSNNNIYWNITEIYEIFLWEQFTWDNPFLPPNTVVIYYNATVIDCFCENNENKVTVKAFERCCGENLFDEDAVTINVECPISSIDVEKQVSRNGDDWYDSIDDIVLDCEEIYWKITVTNTGQTTLSVDLTDDQTGTILSGYTLNTLETWENTYGPYDPQSGLNENTANAIGWYDSSYVEDSDTANYTGKTIAIELEKQVSRNGVDWYDSIDDMIIGVDQVHWKITVTNTGELDLMIDLTDDETGTILSGYTLNTLETWENTYGPNPIEQDLNENTAEVDGYYNQCLVEDMAKANYTGICLCADIDVEKQVSRNGDDWYDSIDDIVLDCEEIYWKITVTNTGQTTLSVDLTDDQTGTILSGYTLNTLETWENTYGPYDPQSGLNENTANAIGWYDSSYVEDSDTANYTGKTIAIELEKQVSRNGVDWYDSIDDMIIGVDQVHWKITVTNTGELDLMIDLTDDETGTILSGYTLNTLETWENTYGPNPIEQDLNENTAEVDGYYNQCLVEDMAKANYTGICLCADIDVEKQVSRNGDDWYDSIDDIVLDCEEIYWKITVTNTGQTTLSVDLTDDQTGTILSGYTLNTLETWENTYGPYDPQSGLNENTANAIGWYDSSYVEDSDTANYTGKTIAIELEKQVSRNGVDWYDSIDDMIIGVDQVHWKITVTNTGGLDLMIDLTDDETGTILSGYTLNTLETWENTYGPNPIEQDLNENTAEVDGYYNQCLVEDMAKANYTGICLCADIDVEKQVSRNGDDWYDSIDDIVLDCEEIYWKITVTNTGQTTLSVDLTDDQTGTILSGYTLNTLETWENTYGPYDPQSGLNENTANAIGWYDSSYVEDSDTANYTGKTIAIELEKQVSRNGVDWYDSIDDMIIGVDQVHWKITVTNTGELDLMIDLTDDETGTILSGYTLNTLETWENTYGPNPIEQDLNENTAEVDGYYNQCLVEDMAKANYTGIYDGGCTYTQGYWKTHTEKNLKKYDPIWGLLDSDNNGEFHNSSEPFFDTGKTYWQILWFPTWGNEPIFNPYRILAKQYIAAELNRLNPFNNNNFPSGLIDDFEQARDILEYYDSMKIPYNHLNRTIAIELATNLDYFNNGNIQGWPHCDDPEPRSIIDWLEYIILRAYQN